MRKERSEEEIELLKTEMKQTLEYMHQKDDILCDACANLGQYNDQFNLGACNILMHIKWEVERSLVQTTKAFNTVCSLDIDEYSDSSDSDEGSSNLDSDSSSED